ncbi:MAG: AEC family transporter [Planctomycetota bacterium]|jgi:predicted permease|nr:AEC family transporter [Planctomycetota bacterium]
MDYLPAILEKLAYVLLLIGSGFVCRGLGWISDQGERELGLLMLDAAWPALIFSSIVSTLDAGDILANIWLPALSLLIHVAGFGLGLAAARLFGFRGDRRRVFLFNCTMNNFLAMALPFAELFFPGRGTALLSVANLGSVIAIWTLGVYAIAGAPDPRQTLRHLYSPGMIATLAAIFCVLSGAGRLIPRLFLDVLATIGQPTLVLGMIVAGAQIYKLGRRALRFDLWNIATGLLRNLAIPAAMLGIALLFRGRLTREALVLFTLVGATPASINSIPMAMKYGSDPELAAQGVIFTHLLGIFTMAMFISLIRTLLFQDAIP